MCSSDLDQVRAGQAVGSVEWEWIARDGVLRDVLVAAAPRRGADGRPVSVLVAAQDVTALKAVQRERDDLRECSIVLAPFVVGGEVAGTLGVLGPTRMDYRKARAAVTAVSQQLGRRLSR